MILEEIITTLREIDTFYTEAPDYLKEFINAMLTAPITITGAEASSQVMTNLKFEKKEYNIKNFKFKFPKIVKKEKWKDFKFDKKRIKYAAKVSPFLGLAVYATTRSCKIPEYFGIDNVFAKSALGPNTWGILYNAMWYSTMKVGEKCKYKLSDVAKYYSNSKNKLINTVSKDGFYFAGTLTLTLWNLVMAANYTFIPEVMQTPVVLFTSFCTTTAMAFTLKDDFIKGYGDKAEKFLTYVPNQVNQLVKSYIKK